jgi:hypothetical protein
MALSSGAGGTHMPRMSFLVGWFEFELVEKSNSVKQGSGKTLAPYLVKNILISKIFLPSFLPSFT